MAIGYLLSSLWSLPSYYRCCVIPFSAVVSNCSELYSNVTKVGIYCNFNFATFPINFRLYLPHKHSKLNRAFGMLV